MAQDEHKHSYDRLVSSVTGIRQGKWVTTEVRACWCEDTATETTEKA
ncbi:MAG TPA: hypothetical protein VGG75_13910 [Trebonia sp.]|jgi:hypothetical protein